jgi:hypothetical protein
MDDRRLSSALQLLQQAAEAMRELLCEIKVPYERIAAVQRDAYT